MQIFISVIVRISFEQQVARYLCGSAQFKLKQYRVETVWTSVEFTSGTSAEFTILTGAEFTSGTVAECADCCGGLSQLVASPPLTSTLPGSTLLLVL